MEYNTNYEKAGDAQLLQPAGNRKHIEYTSYPQNLLGEVFDDDDDIAFPSDILGTLEYVIAEVLPTFEAEILHLRFQQKLSFQAIAEICDSNQDAVRRAQIRGIRKLRHPTCKEYFTNGVRLLRDDQACLLRDKRYSKISEQLDRIERALKQKGENEDRQYKTSDWEREMVWNLCLSTRSSNTLARAGITTVGDILALPNAQALLRIKNLGEKSYKEIIGKLDERGFDVRHLCQ